MAIRRRDVNDPAGWPLKEAGDWVPQRVLARLGPANAPSEHLSYLLVALSVTSGPPRMKLLAERLELEGRRMKPRMDQVVQMPALSGVSPLLREIQTQLATTLKALPAVKARATNDQQGKPNGLRGEDLERLVSSVGPIVLSVEIGTRPSQAGVARVVALSQKEPPIDWVASWAYRLMPGTPQTGAQLYRSDELGGRVVIVYEDGRLAYDPAGSEDEEG
jgi:hypothetical protein